MIKNIKKYWPLFILVVALLVGQAENAMAQVTTQGGGTGTTSPSGILYGILGNLHLQTVKVGTGLLFTGGTLSATGASSTLLTDSNTFSGTINKFTNPPALGVSGLLKGNGSSAISAAVNGTDFTLLTANTCGAGQFFNSATAAGVLGCGTPAGTTYTGNFPIAVSGSVISFGGLSTSSPISAGAAVLYATGVNTTASAATTSLTASGVVSLSSPVSVIGGVSSALTITGGTNGQVLGWLSGVPTWTASSSVLAGTGISISTTGAVTTITNTGSTFSFPFTPLSYGNATGTLIGFTNGILVVGSSTIVGNATTTGMQAFGNVRIPTLGTTAGSFLAVDPNGLVIATSTPSGSNSAFSPAANYATIAGLPSYSYVAGVITEVGNGALSVDGSSPSVGQRVLVKNESGACTSSAGACNNGLYDVTATGSAIATFVLTRDAAYNSSSNVIPGIVTYVISGATLADDFWAMTSASPITIGVTSLNYIEVSGGGSSISSLGPLNQLQTGATQTLATSTTGSDFTITASSNTQTFNLPTASASNRGALSSADWTAFNGKQAAGNYITALTGDVTASGPNSVAATLATVNGNVGSFTNANITVNGKGLITAASNGSGGVYPFTPSTNYNAAASATSTAIWAKLGLQASSTSYFDHVNIGSSTVGTMSTSTDYGNFNVLGWLGVGTTSPSKIFTVEGNQSGGVARIQRDFPSTAANSYVGTYDVQLNETVTGSLSNGSGPSQTFGISNNGAAENLLADITAIRFGADNTGEMVLRPYSVGAPVGNAFVISPGGIGIATSSPFAELSIAANNGTNLTTLFIIASSTQSATTTLLGVSNTGTITTALASGLVLSTSGVLSAFGGSGSCGANNWATTVSSIGTLTCSTIGANGLTLSMFPTIGANTVLANGTGSTATPTAFATSSLFTIGTGLTQTASSLGLTIPVVVSSGGTGVTTLPGNNLLYTNNAGTAFVGVATSSNGFIIKYASTTVATIASEVNLPNSGTVPTLNGGDLYINTNSVASTSLAFGAASQNNNLFAIHSVSSTLASSTLVYNGAYGAAGSTTLAVSNPLHKTTMVNIYCKTDVGTAWVGFGTGAATTTEVQCTSTGALTAVAANNVWNGRQTVFMEIGHNSSAPNNITVTADLEDSN